MTTPKDIAAMLAALPHVFDIEPCTITIRGSAYPAARYKQRCTTPPGSRAHSEGQREYVREMLYAVGMLPAIKRNRNVAFTVDGDAREWFVAAYYGNVSARKQAVATPDKFHPFGNSFIMAPWHIDGDKIDQYARVPYVRVALSITPDFLCPVRLTRPAAYRCRHAQPR